MNILVLDDERAAADALAALLVSYFPDANVQAVYTGEDAVVAGTEHRPDAAILDLEMSGLGGEGTAQALRLAYPDARPLLIAISGNILQLAALNRMGTFDYLLSKPIDVAALVDLLKTRVGAA